MSELKKCPFCGGKAEYYYGYDMIRVQCSICGATTSEWWDQPEEAAMDWNRHATAQEGAEKCKG